MLIAHAPRRIHTLSNVALELWIAAAYLFLHLFVGALCQLRPLLYRLLMFNPFFGVSVEHGTPPSNNPAMQIIPHIRVVVGNLLLPVYHS